MFAIVVGGGKVGANVTRSLAERDQEVVVVEAKASRADSLEPEFGHRVIHGDGTELYVLELAGITRPPDIVVAVTGDDEDNLVIAQLARERYEVPKVIARVNDPRNQSHFDLLGVSPTVCPTASIMALIEHEVPEHALVHLLELRNEGLEIIEVEIDPKCPCVGTPVEQARPARRLQADIGAPRRDRRDRRGRHGAGGRRPGDGDPRAPARERGPKAPARPVATASGGLVTPDSVAA